MGAGWLTAGVAAGAAFELAGLCVAVVAIAGEGAKAARRPSAMRNAAEAARAPDALGRLSEAKKKNTASQSAQEESSVGAWNSRKQPPRTCRGGRAIEGLSVIALTLRSEAVSCNSAIMELRGNTEQVRLMSYLSTQRADWWSRAAWPMRSAQRPAGHAQAAYVAAADALRPRAEATQATQVAAGRRGRK